MSDSGKSERLISLDAFRGIAISGMILVNNPGSWTYVYPQLRHAKWHGVTFTDLIFPFFLFIIGVAMTLSMPKRLTIRCASSGPRTPSLSTGPWCGPTPGSCPSFSLS